MNSRERVRRAMHYQSVDKAPLQYYYCPVGYYEHGDKLNQLYSRYPGDFGPFRPMPIPTIPPEHFDQNGRYHEFMTDEWGVTWEYRIFGITGIPYDRPLKSADDIPAYRVPPPELSDPAAFSAFRAEVSSLHDGGFYALGQASSLYERLLHLYGDENVLCDIAADEPEINDLEERLADRGEYNVRKSIEAGCDGIAIGDDYGTEKGMIMNPRRWREFFKPRLRRMLRPAVQAGLDIHCHSCGQILPILEDLREIGVTSIWPQLPAYNMEELAARCRDLRLAVAIHTDRARTMTYGSPSQVRDLVRREFDTFRVLDGGSWFYVEADNGFPFENLQALVETIGQWR